MNTEHLSKRLAAVAAYVEKGAIIADIGSDHAYLPCHLIKNGLANRAIAGEVVKGPYEAAVRNVAKEGLSSHIQVRLGSGLSVLQDHDKVDTVLIAGMGGPLIASILEQGRPQLADVKKIVAQPNIQAKVIREWAVANGWHLTDESIVKEDGKIYEILVLEKGHTAYTELELLTGPYLLAEHSDVFLEKWQREEQEWKRVLEALDRAEQNENILLKKEQLRNQIQIIKGVLSN